LTKLAHSEHSIATTEANSSGRRAPHLGRRPRRARQEELRGGGWWFGAG
jgi:hypothetical protein